MSDADYSDVSYWDQRYAVDMEPYEFYQQPAALRSFILPLILCKRPQHAQQQQQQQQQPAPSLLLPPHQHSADTAALPRPPTRSPSADGHRKTAGGGVKDGSGSVKHQAGSGSGGDGRLRVLVLGCGSSELSLEVWRMLAGDGEVLSIDFSLSCVEEMQRRHSDKPGMTCQPQHSAPVTAAAVLPAVAEACCPSLSLSLTLPLSLRLRRAAAAVPERGV